MKKQENCGELTSKGSAEGTLLLQNANHNASDIEREATGEIILYQPDETIRLEVKLERETVWLTQQQMADLFGKERSGITKHISNIFNEGELEEESNVSFFTLQILINLLNFLVLMSLSLSDTQIDTRFDEQAIKIYELENIICRHTYRVHRG